MKSSLSKIEKGGGEIVKPILAFPGGRRSRFTDPSVNGFAVWSEESAVGIFLKIRNPPSGTTHQIKFMNTKRNPVGWFEIYVQDMERAKKFYEAVLAKPLEQLTDPNDGEMAMWAFPMEMDAPGAAGALVEMEGAPSGGGGTLVYFSCGDCAVEEARIVPNGGNVHKPKFAIGEFGFISLVSDTEGNMVGLHSMK